MPTTSHHRALPGFRPDVEGMRAVAVILVIAFHAGLTSVAGGYVGVDVFFVLSGFLITGLLLDELYRTGSVSLVRFYARRARRLLPMSALVLVVTAVLARRYVPPLDFSDLATDIRAAALYVSNWHFAAESTDYMSGAYRSPVLHYWSLSVEEQFYLVWPLLLLAVAVAGRRDRRLLDRRLAVGLAVLGVASFFLSVTTSASSGPWAYFGLHTRAWELSAGAALAIARPSLPRLRVNAARCLGWIGLSAVVGSAVLFGADTVFPGLAAAVPVGGTMLLIAAGASPRSGASATSVLSLPAVTYVGRISYAWYLWHWPLLMMATRRFGAAATTEGGAADGTDAAQALPLLPTIGAVIASFALAVFSHHVLESPVRRTGWLVRSGPKSLALGAALTAAAVLVVGVVLAPRPFIPPPQAQAATAQLRATDAAATRPQLSVSPDAARDDRPQGTETCYRLGRNGSKAGKPCVFGDPHAARTIVLVGDSQAEQWVPALDRYGQQHRWKVLLWAKASCPFNDVPIWLWAFKGDYKPCRVWRDNVYAAIRALPRVDTVVMSRARSYAEMVIQEDGQKTTVSSVKPYWRAGTVRTLRRLAEFTDRVVLMHSTPVATSDIPACLSENVSTPEKCAFPRGDAIRDPLMTPEKEAATVAGFAVVADVTTAICSDDPCPPLTPDGRIIYRDQHHLTASFARRLSDVFGAVVVGRAG